MKIETAGEYNRLDIKVSTEFLIFW